MGNVPVGFFPESKSRLLSSNDIHSDLPSDSTYVNGPSFTVVFYSRLDNFNLLIEVNILPSGEAQWCANGWNAQMAIIHRNGIMIDIGTRLNINYIEMELNIKLKPRTMFKVGFATVYFPSHIFKGDWVILPGLWPSRSPAGLWPVSVVPGRDVCTTRAN